MGDAVPCNVKLRSQILSIADIFCAVLPQLVFWSQGMRQQVQTKLSRNDLSWQKCDKNEQERIACLKYITIEVWHQAEAHV